MDSIKYYSERIMEDEFYPEAHDIFSPTSWAMRDGLEPSIPKLWGSRPDLRTGQQSAYKSCQRPRSSLSLSAAAKALPAATQAPSTEVSYCCDCCSCRGNAFSPSCFL